ncbi:cupin domain-containing protein [Bacillus solitudinis]|uniref:cupin domain-containing protein n=1 Tax=Bacillus solitudinis TaxID=2014074 RepID=UPI000C244A42|nr:cupin domain-containing protein [Bacillus solitudinis]
MVKRDVLNTQGSLMMVKVELKKDFYADVDRHIEEQISYIEKGSVEFEVGGVKRILKEGDSQYIPSNIEHRVKVIEDCTILDVFTPIRKDLIDK